MRFNDLLRTVLANTGENASAAITRWRQCMDMLAQYDVSGKRSGLSITAPERNILLSIIEETRPQVSLDQRIASVVELGGRLRSPALIRLLSQDHPTLVVAMMEVVRLTGDDWARIIPDLGPLARSVLRRRADLDSTALAALRQFGEIDMSLPSHQGADETPGDAITSEGVEPAEVGPIEPVAVEPVTQRQRPIFDNSSQIGRLVERIERFKQTQGPRTAPSDQPAPIIDSPTPEPVEGIAAPQDEPLEVTAQFLFETDSAGLVQVVDGAPQASLRGLNISAPSVDSRYGVDGATLGAFRHRAAFENARLILPDGFLAGEWRMDGEPHFDRLSGRFLGYTGSARRERRYESPVRASADVPTTEWSGLSAASMRQLIHELRTPLNAVQGYSEMIEAQILGPVPKAYRKMAKSILEDARALIETFDDLDMASRIVRGDIAQDTKPVDLISTLSNVLTALDEKRAERIDLSVQQDLPMVHGQAMHIERMLKHLVRASLAALGRHERLGIKITATPAHSFVNLDITRPAALQGLNESELFESGYLIDDKVQDDGSALGLAFTLRLVRGIVRHLGGSFKIAPENFHISLNALPMTGAGQENNA